MLEPEARNYEQIEKLWDSMTKVRNDIAKLTTAIERLTVILSGVDGNNGLMVRVRDLEEGRDEMEERMIKLCRDCGVGSTLKGHLESHEKAKVEGLTTKRFVIGQAIVIILFILSIFLKR